MIIGVCGAIGSGKNTVGEFLVKDHGFTQLAFADPIYDAISAITGLTVEELKDRNRKENTLDWISCSPRRLLQTLGTDWGREMIHPEIWVVSALRRVRGDTVITDVRFNNEAEAILARGGAIWRVVGREIESPSKHRAEAGIADKYVSETLQNSGPLECLRLAVDSAYERLLSATIGV